MDFGNGNEYYQWDCIMVMITNDDICIDLWQWLLNLAMKMNLDNIFTFSSIYLYMTIIFDNVFIATIVTINDIVFDDFNDFGNKWWIL